MCCLCRLGVTIHAAAGMHAEASVLRLHCIQRSRERTGLYLIWITSRAAIPEKINVRQIGGNIMIIPRCKVKILDRMYASVL